MPVRSCNYPVLLLLCADTSNFLQNAPFLYSQLQNRGESLTALADRRSINCSVYCISSIPRNSFQFKRITFKWKKNVKGIKKVRYQLKTNCFVSYKLKNKALKCRQERTRISVKKWKKDKAKINVHFNFDLWKNCN